MDDSNRHVKVMLIAEILESKPHTYPFWFSAFLLRHRLARDKAGKLGIRYYIINIRDKGRGGIFQMHFFLLNSVFRRLDRCDSFLFEKL